MIRSPDAVARIQLRHSDDELVDAEIEDASAAADDHVVQSDGIERHVGDRGRQMLEAVTRLLPFTKLILQVGRPAPVELASAKRRGRLSEGSRAVLEVLSERDDLFVPTSDWVAVANVNGHSRQQ